MKTFSFLLIALFIFTEPLFCQDSLQTPSYEKYLVKLNIPKTWDVVRRLEGNDLTLSGYSPDDKFFIYYCQFMEDKKPRPKKYLETYSAQFGLDVKKMEVRSLEINEKKMKFYYLKDEADFLNEKFKILFFATWINNRNVIAYLIYPLNSSEEIEMRINEIMLYHQE